MNVFRAYNLVLIGAIVTAACATLVASRFVQPMAGDLTRSGGLLENDFGWNEPQEFFQGKLFARKWPAQRGTPLTYDRYFDVVVVGDSFSNHSMGNHTREGTYWQNYFVNQTGVSLITLDNWRDGLESVLDMPAFEASPPRLLILQTIERELRWFAADSGECNERRAGRRVRMPPLQVRPMGLPVHTYVRPESAGWESIRSLLNYAISALARMLGVGHTEVRIVPISAPTRLFSSSRHDEMLITFRDMRLPWNAEIQERIVCGIMKIRDRVERQGRTRFLLLVAPDKRTAYEPYIADGDLRGMSVLHSIDWRDIEVLATLKALRLAIASPANKDVYLTNDTHWGFVGHKTVADALIRRLARMGLLAGEGSRTAGSAPVSEL